MAFTDNYAKERLIDKLDMAYDLVGAHSEDCIYMLFPHTNWLDYPDEWLDVLEELRSIAAQISHLKIRVDSL